MRSLIPVQSGALLLDFQSVEVNVSMSLWLRGHIAGAATTSHYIAEAILSKFAQEEVHLGVTAPES